MSAAINKQILFKFLYKQQRQMKYRNMISVKITADILLLYYIFLLWNHLVEPDALDSVLIAVIV